MRLGRLNVTRIVHGWLPLRAFSHVACFSSWRVMTVNWGMRYGNPCYRHDKTSWFVIRDVCVEKEDELFDSWQTKAESSSSWALDSLFRSDKSAESAENASYPYAIFRLQIIVKYSHFGEYSLRNLGRKLFYRVNIRERVSCFRYFMCILRVFSSCDFP